MRISQPVRLVAALAMAVALVVSIAAPAQAGRGPAGVTWITGTLLDSSGDPVAGAEVTLTAWPSGSQLAALSPDEDVVTVDAGTTVTDAQGAFSFQHDVLLDNDLQSLTDGTFIVDLTVEATSGNQYWAFSTSRFLTELVSPSGEEAEAIDDSPITMTPIGTAAASGTQPAFPPSSCPFRKIATLGPRWVVVGAGSTTTDVTMKFTYSSGSNTSIGIGVSLNGGPFKASGTSTSTLTSSGSIGFATVTGVTGKVWRTQFVFAKFKSVCASGTRVEVRAVGWAGGASALTSTIPTTSASNCVTQPATTDFTLDYSRASAFTAAVNGDIGIYLSATTGWSSKTKIYFYFAKTRHLCGKNSLPGMNPGVLVAKA